MFQNYGRFNFGHQFWFLGLVIIIFTKILLWNNNITIIVIISLIIYIEISMGIFIMYINIIRSLSRCDYTNFKFSLVIKIISFNGIKNMAHLAMVVIFHVNVITCQNFDLPHIYRILVEKNHFLRWKFSNWSHGIQT